MLSDGLVVWKQEHQKFNFTTISPQALISHSIEALWPAYLGNDCWHYHLGNARVLVVTSMPRTVARQAERFHKIWKGASLQYIEVIEAPQPPWVTESTPKYSNWLDALRELRSLISAQTFDICIIGAGAYSLPLASYCKSIGRIGVHLGGMTQLLFGIAGRRWDTEYSGDGGEWARRMGYRSNEFWVYPCSEDTPINSKLVENGCYW